jgi:hypothetical protein
MALLFLAALLATAVPKIGLAQSNPLVGTWKLNLAKSKFMPGPPPRSTTLTFAGEGENLTDTAEIIDASGSNRISLAVTGHYGPAGLHSFSILRTDEVHGVRVDSSVGSCVI